MGLKITLEKRAMVGVQGGSLCSWLSKAEWSLAAGKSSIVNTWIATQGVKLEEPNDTQQIEVLDSGSQPQT